MIFPNLTERLGAEAGFAGGGGFLGAPPILPAPIDTPTGPEGVAPPEATALPRLVVDAPPDAPLISAISEVTFPDETLVATGAGLEGASLNVWGEGYRGAITPLRTHENRLQAVLPADAPVSTLLVWPTRDGVAGRPIRVNGATAWWLWPARAWAGRPGQTVRVFGKTLALEGETPKVYLRGRDAGAWLPVRDASLWTVEAELPDHIEAGEYELWTHNGTGGGWGWSERLRLVVEAPPKAEPELPRFRADDFGAQPDSEDDAAGAIQAALTAAEKAGGGVVELSEGVYRVGRPLIIAGAGEAGVILQGAGMGAHTWRTAPPPNDHKVLHTVSGARTVLAPLADESPWPAELLRVERRHSVVRDLTLINHADSKIKQRCLSVWAHDVAVERVRVIVVDERPFWKGFDKPIEQATMAEVDPHLLDAGAVFVDAPGEANIEFRHCQFHHPGAGIETARVHHLLRHDARDTVCPPGTDYLRLADCVFRGYFDGRLEPYFEPGRNQSKRGWMNMALVNNNSKRVIVERCDFAGADKENFKVLTRCLNHRNTSLRDLYLAGNKGHNLAPTSATPGYHPNKGEMFIFHLMYPAGGLFDVLDADERSIVLDTGNPKYGEDEFVNRGIIYNSAGNSAVPGDVEANPSHWVVFVCAGRGVGQVRVVRACERIGDRVRLIVEHRWRVPPDATSRIVLNAAYRRIIVTGNELDGAPNDRRVKSHGVCFWANSFDNIVAGNTYRNLAGGVIFNAFYRCPTGWNLTRDNVFESIRGNGGDTSFPGLAACYVDHVRVGVPRPEDRVWITAANIARHNRARDADVAAFLHRPVYGNIPADSPNLSSDLRADLENRKNEPNALTYDYPDMPEGGHMLSVLEHNRFEAVDRGIVTSAPANWQLLRDNLIETASGSAPPVEDESEGRGEAGGARETLIME